MPDQIMPEGYIAPPENPIELPSAPLSNLNRIGEQAANLPSNILNKAMRLTYNLGIGYNDQQAPAEVETPFNIPTPQGITQHAIDIGSNIASDLPFFAAGGSAATPFKAAPLLSRILGTGGSFAASGLTRSPEESATQGALGAGIGAVESMFPGPARYAAAAILGGATGLEAKEQGASNTQALVQGATNTLLPLIFGKRNSIPKEAKSITEEKQKLLGYGGNRNQLEDVQSTTIIPGTGGIIPYGGELTESTTRAKHIFGTEQISSKPIYMGDGPIIDIEANVVGRNTNGALMDNLLPPPKPVEGSLVREPAFTDIEARKGLGITAPEGSIIREPTFTEKEIINGKVKPELATLQEHTPVTAKNWNKVSEELGLQKPYKYENMDMVSAADPTHGGNIDIPIGATVSEVKALKENKASQFSLPKKRESLEQLDVLRNEAQSIRDKIEARLSQGTKEGITEFTPGTFQSIQKIGPEADNIAAIKAVADGTKPVTFRSGKSANFVKQAKAEGLKISRFKNKSGGLVTVAHNSNLKAVQNLKNAFLSEAPNIERDALLGKALGFKDEEIAAFAAKRPEVATLQEKVASPSSPLETPTGISYGDKVQFRRDGEIFTGTINPGEEPNTYRLIEKDGTLHDIPKRDIITTPQSKFSLETEGEIKQVGGMRGIEQAQTSSEPGSAKLPGGGKMKLSNFGEHGSIDPEVAALLGKYVAAPAIGAAVGYTEDDEHRLSSAIMGAFAGGLVGKFGIDAVKYLAKGSSGKTATGVSKMGMAKGNTIDFVKAITGNEKMAAKAASQWGLSSGYDKIARWVEKNFTTNPAVSRMLDKAHGEINVLSETMRDSLKDLSGIENVNLYQDKLSKFFEGNIVYSNLASSVPKEIAQLAATAVQSRNALQKIVWEGLGPGKLSTKIQQSLGSYLTTSYRIFHDAKYKPTDQQIQSAAQSLGKEWGTLDTRIDMIQEYLHEIQVNKGTYFGGKGSGEKFDSILARKEELTPEFKDMLGVYDNPIERMSFTGAKLVRGAKSAEFFNEVARGEKQNGLKYAYTTAEREAQIATLQTRAKLAHSPEEREAANVALSELRDYVRNSEGVSSGRLAHQWLDRRMRDQLATYESASELYRSAWSRQMVNATNLIKYNQIILSPLQFTRQVMSMPIMGIMAKTTPVDWVKAASTVFKGGEEITRLKKLGIIGADPVGGMLRKDMANLMDGSLDRVLGERVMNGLHKWEEVWRTPDLIVRISAFQRREAQLLEQYGVSDSQRATQEAIDYANRYTMNYNVAPQGVKIGRQLPFVNQYLNFAYEAIRIAKNLGEDAAKGDLHAIGALATVATAPFIIQQLSEQQLSPEDRKEWQQVKDLGRDYERHNFKFVIGKLPNGDFRYISFSPLVPHDPWLQSFRAIMSGDKDALAAVNPVFGWENTPLLNVASTLVTGRNRFSGNKLYSVGDYADSIRKDIAPLLLGNDLDRIKRALTPNENGELGVIDQRTGRVSSIEDIIQTYATSMRPYTVKPAYLLYQAKQEVLDRIHAQQTTYRNVLATNASADTKAQAKDNYDKALTQILLSYKEKYGATVLDEDAADVP